MRIERPIETTWCWATSGDMRITEATQRTSQNQGMSKSESLLTISYCLRRCSDRAFVRKWAPPDKEHRAS